MSLLHCLPPASLTQISWLNFAMILTCILWLLLAGWVFFSVFRLSELLSFTFNALIVNCKLNNKIERNIKQLL